ncbi:MAG TPA: COQ9 family protein [Caulobacteraceae bacterium]|jgi:ubiquinone biosynthesis protein COQ9
MSSDSDWAPDAEQRVLDEALRLAPETGWNGRLVARAAAAAGLSKGDAELLLPNGAKDLAALATARHLDRAFSRLEGVDPVSLKVRERIRVAVQAKIEGTVDDGPALRNLAGFLCLPQNLPLALALLWKSADAIWRWAGDTAVDENHYSKRAILSAILATTLAVRMTSGKTAADAHLDARIDNVMAFERWKAGRTRWHLGPEIAVALARVRYGRG